jgi:hypothetical protein
VYILKMEGTGQRVKWKLTAYFVLSRTETTWITNLYRWRWRCETIKAKEPRPVQLLRVPLNTSNNYKKQRKYTKTRGQDSKIFKSFILTPKDGVGNSKPKLTLTSNGDLVLTTGEQPQYNRSSLDNGKGSVENTNCSKLCSLPEFNSEVKWCSRNTSYDRYWYL